MENEIKPLTHSEVSKKIIAKTIEERPEEDLIGPFGKYNDELHEIYNKKKQEFFETCKQYNKLNQETLFYKDERLHEDYQRSLYCPFLEDDEFEPDCKINNKSENEDFPEGYLVRKRTERPVHMIPATQEADCSLESWFRRHRILNKFIRAARTVVLKNRLEKVLVKLKELDTDKIKKFEHAKPFVHNVSYADVFQKYL